MILIEEEKKRKNKKKPTEDNKMAPILLNSKVLNGNQA